MWYYVSNIIIRRYDMFGLGFLLGSLWATTVYIAYNTKHRNRRLQKKLDQITDSAEILEGEGDMIELDEDNLEHREWYEDE